MENMNDDLPTLSGFISIITDINKRKKNLIVQTLQIFLKINCYLN